jgi:hypothetical protein
VRARGAKGAPLDWDKPAPTSGFLPDPNVKQLSQGCLVHPDDVDGGSRHVETMLYDVRDDSYLQRCSLTGKTWWAREDK